MRSRRDRTMRRAWLCAAVAALAVSTGILARQGTDPAPRRGPDREEIARARAQVEADPALGPLRTIRLLRWAGPTDRASLPGWLAWLRGLVTWIAASARALVWVAAALLAGLLVVYIARLVRARGGRAAGHPALAPTHVRDLDIRPESLPDDVGAAARALWDRGEHRAALALLYRALLSRLAHVHRIPIRDSTTEGQCLLLAAAHLPGDRIAYVSSLVRLWQRAVYGGEAADAAAVHAICLGFGPALDAAPSTEGSGGAA